LLSALGGNPRQFADRQLYVLIYEQRLSEEAVEVADQVRTELGDNWGAFEDWEDIPEGDVIAFYLGPRGGFYYDGCYRFREPREE